MKKLRKKLKKIGRKAIAVTSKVASVAAPVVGAAFFGPAGAAAGTAAAAAHARYAGAAGARAKGKHGKDARKAGRKAAVRALKIGAAVTGGSAILAVAGGAGLTAPASQAFGGLFGSKASGGSGTATGSESETMSSTLPGDLGGGPVTFEQANELRLKKAGGSLASDVFGAASSFFNGTAKSETPTGPDLGGGVFPGAGIDQLQEDGEKKPAPAGALLVIGGLGLLLLLGRKKK